MNNGDGGESIYGDPFKDESFQRRHHAAGCLSMANRGRNSNTSQSRGTAAGAGRRDSEARKANRVQSSCRSVCFIERIL